MREFEYASDQVIQTCSIETLLAKEYLHRLALWLVRYGFSREGGAGFLAATLGGWPGPVLDFGGAELRRHEDYIERAYGYGPERGRYPDWSWHTDIKRFATVYPKNDPQARLASRLELWDAAFKIIDDPVMSEW